MATVTLAARALLVLVFATAASTKLLRPAASRATFEGFGVSGRLAGVGAVALAPAELAVAAALVFGPSARWGAVGAALLLLIFIAGITTALRHGRTPDCGCFGAFRPTPIGRSTLVRNGLLLAVSVAVVAAAPGPAADHWASHHGIATVALTALLVVAAFAAVVYRSSGFAPAAVEQGDPDDVPMLRVGEAAPTFELSNAGGQLRTLSSLCEPTRPLILVFGTAGCGTCVNLFPHLARWQRSLGERLQIVLVVAGDTDIVRSIADQHGLPEVLADPDRSVSRAYTIRINPSAYALGPDGRIVTGPAIGPDAIQDLIRLTLSRDAPMPEPWHPRTHAVA